MKIHQHWSGSSLIAWRVSSMWFSLLKTVFLVVDLVFFCKSICCLSLSLQFASEYDTIPWFEYMFKDFISLWLYADTFHFGIISQTSSHETERNKSNIYPQTNSSLWFDFSLFYLWCISIVIYCLSKLAVISSLRL